MNAFVKFNLGILRLPVAVRIWLLILMAVNLVIPIVYLDRIEARVVLLTFLASFLLMIAITATSGFTRLLSLGHILWIFLVAFLISRLELISSGDSYHVWMLAVIALNSISLVIDLVDFVRFARGERSEVVSIE